MAADVVRTRMRVQRFLHELLGEVTPSDDGTFAFRSGSATVHVAVEPYGDATVVDVYAVTNCDVPPSPELFRYVALAADRYVFGHLGAHESDAGTIDVTFSYRVLGDFLDPEELDEAIQAVALIADDLDDRIRDRFGGRLFDEGGRGVA